MTARPRFSTANANRSLPVLQLRLLQSAYCTSTLVVLPFHACLLKNISHLKTGRSLGLMTSHWLLPWTRLQNLTRQVAPHNYASDTLLLYFLYFCEKYIFENFKQMTSCDMLFAYKV